MTSFNLSAWAITHRPLVHYFMAMLVVIGVASYMKLGRNEDPTFTIKAMTVRTQWPGATVNDTLLQITERIERKLQETPYLDYIKSYTNPGQSTIFVYLKGSTGPKEVSDAWYQVRKKIKDIELTLPQGVIGPVADDEFGDTYGIVYGFTADGFTHRELRDYVEEIRSRLLQVPDVNKVNLIGQQAERIFIEFSPTKLAGYGFKPAELAAALQAQNAVAPTGVITTDEESITLRVSGAMASEKDIAEMNFDVGGRNVRLADIAEVRREYSDPPDPMFRINGTPGLGLSISMRDGGDVLALGENIHHTMEELKADLPIGIEPVMVANQPETVHRSIDEFMEALWESIAIVLVVSVLSLGLRAGAIVIICIPLVLAIVFAAMYALGIDLQRISLGALIISLGLLVDDAMITIESTVFRLERGDDKSTGRHIRLCVHCATAPYRHARYYCRIRAGRLRAQRRRRVHVLAFRGRGHRAARLLGGLRHLRTRRRDCAAAAAEASTWRDTERTDAAVQTLSAGGDAGKVDNHSGDARLVRGIAMGAPLRP